MKVSYNWLNSYFDSGLFKKGLPKPEKLAELFNAHFAEVESMEKVGGDTIMEVKTLADRNHYVLCHRGMAREASVITKKPLKAAIAPNIEVQAGVPQVAVSLEDPKLCRRYAARRVEGVSAANSPKWLSERLESIGARSINAVVDATNFVMFDIGQPLHAFDADKVRGGIVVRKAKAGEKIVILDGREIELRDSDLIIADTDGPLAIAGVKGGKRAEVTKETKNIIIESANFEPSAVRRTSTRTNLRNDSSKRFENEITPALAGEAIDRVTALIQEIAGGKAGAVTDIYPNPAKPWTVTVSAAELSSVIGVAVAASEAKDILERQGCAVAVTGDELSVTPPLDRLDMVIPEDIADEVARIRGYDSLPSTQTPKLAEATPIDPTFYHTERLKNILVDFGFSEVQTYVLVAKGAYEVAYPLASDKSSLRERIVPKLSESLAMNARNADLLGLDAIKIFEIGKVFPQEGEKTVLAIGVTLLKKKKGVTAESIVKDALVALGIDAAAVKIENGIAEIDLDALISNMPKPISLADLHFTALPKDKKYKPFSAYPFITRDIAFFAPAGTDVTAAQSVISQALKDAGSLVVKGPDLFDRFEKDGRVSYGFRMIFQSFEKTLSDEEVKTFMDKVYEAVKGKGWEAR